MTKINTVYCGGLHTEATHVQSGTVLTTDAPLDNHGRGESFSPTDLFATSLTSCMMTIMGISAESYGFSIEGLRAETEKIMAANPRRVAEIIIDLYFSANNYTDQQKRLIESAARTCPVHNSMSPDVIKTIRFHYE